MLCSIVSRAAERDLIKGEDSALKNNPHQRSSIFVQEACRCHVACKETDVHLRE